MLRVLPLLLLLAWTCDATSQTRGGQDRYIGEMAVELEGTWDANPTLERLQTAPRRNLTDPLINLGNDGQWHWIELTGLSRAFGSQFLEVATAQIDSLTFLSTCNGNLKDGPLHLNGVSIRGTSDGMGQSLTDGTFPMFPLGGADLCEEDKIYLGVKSGKQISLPLRVASLNDLREWSFMRDVFFSFYAGIMLVMLLYNLVLYFTVEDRSYLLYVLFLIGVALSQLFLAGYQGVIPGWDGTSWLGLRAVHFVGIFQG